jgi:hypothetical protein
VARRDRHGLRVVLADGSEIRPDKVLVSSGRVGNTDGFDATEAIHVGQPALSHSDPIDYFIEKTFNVPTFCEAYKYAAYDGLERWRDVTSS